MLKKIINQLNYKALLHLLHPLNLQRNLERNLERNHHREAHKRKLPRKLHSSNNLKISQLELLLRVLKLLSHLLKKPHPPLEPLLLQQKKPLFQPKKLHQKLKPPMYKLSKQRKLQQKHKLKPKKLMLLLKSLKQKLEK